MWSVGDERSRPHVRRGGQLTTRSPAILDFVPFTEEEIQRISEAATPDALVPAPQEALEVVQHIADAALDAYTEDDWRYVLNALRPDRAAIYISSRPPKDRPKLLLLVTPIRRAAVERDLVVFAA